MFTLILAYSEVSVQLKCESLTGRNHGHPWISILKEGNKPFCPSSSVFSLFSIYVDFHLSSNGLLDSYLYALLNIEVALDFCYQKSIGKNLFVQFIINKDKVAYNQSLQTPP